MIDLPSWEWVKFWGLTALLNPYFLAILLGAFFLGKLVGSLTKRLNIWKLLLLAYLGVFLFEPLRASGPIIGGLFLLGFFSRHLGTVWGVLSWAGSIGDAYRALKYRSVYDDVRRREEELEERERKLREAELRQAYQQQEQGQQARSGWQQKAKGFRQKPEEKTRGQSSKNRQSGNSKSQDHKQRSRGRYPPTSQSSLRDKHLRTLGLEPGRDYSPDELKKAFRRCAMRTHPDAGGSNAAFVVIQEAYAALKSKP